MTTWTRILIGPSSTMRQAIEAIDASGLQMVLIVDGTRRLLGTVSDGDVRRAILKGTNLETPVTLIMNSHPTVAKPGDDRELTLATMQSKRLHRVPVVDSKGCVIGLETFDDLVMPARRDNLVVLMAGGLGTRLHPMTADRPKPMLEIGDKPILETILLNFIEYGFHRFYISVNYKAETIKSYFQDGSAWNVDIGYLEETTAMGTAGCLTLLPEVPDAPLIVMNGDVLTKVNFQLLLDFHQNHGASATMSVREYDFQVPYGVVKLEDHRLIGIEEKPVQRVFVSAGIYVLEPAVLKLLPRNEPYDMPGLFEQLMRNKQETIAFPIREYWLDVGRPSDFDKANGDFTVLFQ